jgi:hypothetical protein
MEIVKNEVETSAELLSSSMYLKISNQKAENLQKMIDLLNKRKDIIGSSKEKLTDFENNERAILLHKTDYELAKHHTSLMGIKNEVKGYTEKATEILEEMGAKWNEVMARAKKDAMLKKDISSVLESVTEEQLNGNIDLKINHYLQLKSMVYNTGKLKKV